MRSRGDVRLPPSNSDPKSGAWDGRARTAAATDQTGRRHRPRRTAVGTSQRQMDHLGHCCRRRPARTFCNRPPGPNARKAPVEVGDGGLCVAFPAVVPGDTSLVGALLGDALERTPRAVACSKDRGARRQIANATARREAADAQGTARAPLSSLDCVHLGPASRSTSYSELQRCPYPWGVTAATEVFGGSRQSLT